MRKLTHPAIDPAHVDHHDSGSPSEVEFAAQLRDALIDFEREWCFDESRRWRFDFAWPAAKVAVEIDGDVHRLKHRFSSDREKGNAATIAGWRVLHFSPMHVDCGYALKLTETLLAAHGAFKLPQEKR